MRLRSNAELAGLEIDDRYARLEEIADEPGYFESLGDGHCAAFLVAGTDLLVTFESTVSIRNQNAGAEPRGLVFTKTEGWPHLAIISDA